MKENTKAQNIKRTNNNWHIPKLNEMKENNKKTIRTYSYNSISYCILFFEVFTAYFTTHVFDETFEKKNYILCC